MKKTYINPQLEVIEIAAQQAMLTQSNMGLKGNYDSNTITIGGRGMDDDCDDEEEW